jgi:hypothetical protein
MCGLGLVFLKTYCIVSSYQRGKLAKPLSQDEEVALYSFA